MATLLRTLANRVAAMQMVLCVAIAGLKSEDTRIRAQSVAALKEFTFLASDLQNMLNDSDGDTRELSKSAFRKIQHPDKCDCQAPPELVVIELLSYENVDDKVPAPVAEMFAIFDSYSTTDVRYELSRLGWKPKTAGVFEIVGSKIDGNVAAVYVRAPDPSAKTDHEHFYDPFILICQNNRWRIMSDTVQWRHDQLLTSSEMLSFRRVAQWLKGQQWHIERIGE